MAENKKTFIFYSDWINLVREMDNEDAGELLKHLLSYVNDEDPTTDNKFVKMAFGHMKPMLKKDLDKWDKQLKKYSDMGKASAKKRSVKPKVTEVEPRLTQVEPTCTVNDNVNVYSNISFIDKMDLFKKKIGEEDNVIWRDNVYRMHKIQQGKLFKVVEQFTIHLAIQNNGEYKDNFAEFRRHCSNWIGTQIQSGKLSEFRTVKAIGSI